MGSNASIYRDWIEKEFNERAKKRTPMDEKPHLVLEDLINFKLPREHQLDPTHLPTLFILDGNRDGKFHIEELVELASLYSEKLNETDGAVDFARTFQGYCTMCLWSWISSPNGNEEFVEWLIRLFTYGITMEIKGHEEKFVTRDSMKLMHHLLRIDVTYGLNYLDFFDLMQRVGEEMNLMTLDDELLDEVVPVDVIKLFGTHLTTGFVKFMLELGFVEKQVNFP